MSGRGSLMRKMVVKSHFNFLVGDFDSERTETTDALCFSLSYSFKPLFVFLCRNGGPIDF